MPMYSYKGRSARGELITGRLDGDTADNVAARLLNGGITPVEITALAASNDIDLSRFSKMIGAGKPTIADLVLFSRQMFTITKAGIPLLRGMRSLAMSTHNTILREAMEDILASLESGRDLASSFARHPDIFPPLYISIVRVGESTGTLETSFKRMAEYLEQDQQTQQRVKSAMRYPIIVMVVIAVAIGILTTFVIPRFAPLFRALGNDIPLPTRIIMGVSEFAQHYWYVVLLGIAAIVFGVRQYLRTPRGRFQWDEWRLKIPVLGKLTHQAILARVSRSLSISLTAGMPMIQTLNVIAKSSGNEFMADRINRLRLAVERGDPLSRAAAGVEMFPPLVLQMMTVGEETGELAELLDEVAEFYEREVDYALKNLSAAIEPILIIFVGGMVLILALGVFLPMWNMIAKVGGQ
ncbi:MAG TPA: type II secretion system F family protein [Steroidobacteraceae bacterium]|nr:type II secretion system F family protein [Steroidobacteraceae bacterium]